MLCKAEFNVFVRVKTELLDFDNSREEKVMMRTNSIFSNLDYI